MTYNPNMDRDYWRSSDTPKLIEAARDSGHELAIALGERLQQLHDREEWADQIEDLKMQIAGLESDLSSLQGELAAAEDALETAYEAQGRA